MFARCEEIISLYLVVFSSRGAFLDSLLDIFFIH